MYEELVKQMRERAGTLYNTSRFYDSDAKDAAILYKAADAIEELSKPRWIPVTERLPECENGTEVGNIEWIRRDMVYAGCFGRGGKYRDAYFRTWTDGTEGMDAMDADCWRLCQIPEPPKEET